MPEPAYRGVQADVIGDPPLGTAGETFVSAGNGVGGADVEYDWSGARSRRIKMLKLGVPLLIVLATAAFPASLLLRMLEAQAENEPRTLPMSMLRQFSLTTTSLQSFVCDSVSDNYLPIGNLGNSQG